MTEEARLEEVVGTRLFPYIIISTYNIMYDIPDILMPFNVPYSLLSSLSMILCTLAVTLWACWAELREVQHYAAGLEYTVRHLPAMTVMNNYENKT